MILVYECLRKKKKGREKRQDKRWQRRENGNKSSIFDLCGLVMHLASDNWKAQGECEQRAEALAQGGRPLSITCVHGPLRCWHCITVPKRQFWTEHKTVPHPYNLHLDAAEIRDGSTSKLSLQFQSKSLPSWDACYLSYKMVVALERKFQWIIFLPCPLSLEFRERNGLELFVCLFVVCFALFYFSVIIAVIKWKLTIFFRSQRANFGWAHSRRGGSGNGQVCKGSPRQTLLFLRHRKKGNSTFPCK